MLLGQRNWNEAEQNPLQFVHVSLGNPEHEGPTAGSNVNQLALILSSNPFPCSNSEALFYPTSLKSCRLINCNGCCASTGDGSYFKALYYPQ